MLLEYDDVEFLVMTSELLAQTRDDWLSKIQGNTLEELVPMAESKINMYSNWFQKDLEEEASNQPSYYVLQVKETGEIVGIIQLTDATKGKDPSFKLLNLFFDPVSNLEFKEEDSLTPEAIKRIGSILSLALTKSVIHAFTKGNKFKMYLRTNELATLFETIIALQNGNQRLYSVNRQGSWLVFDLI